MRISVQTSLWMLLPLALILGCDHKTQQATQAPQALAPPIVDTPPPKPAAVSTADLPPPVIGNPQPAPSTPPTQHEEPAKKTPHKRKPVTPTSSTSTELAKVEPPATPSGNSADPPSVSAVGNLTGGASGDQKSETEQTIDATEKGVNSITRSLSESEVKTAAQIREFLKQARDALKTGDADGAHTLAMKAKVLLTELNQ